jgi:two-component system, LytTR family, response regulator LytT
MKIQCVIVDDEPLAIRVISDHLQQVPWLELAATFTHPVKALEYLSEHDTDLLFLDIQMPDLSGLDLIRGIKTVPVLILTTAFDQYALEGFRVDAVDYLLKPVDFPDFLKAVTKARELIEARKNRPSQVRSDKEFLFIKSEYKVLRIDLGDILYIQGMSEYVRIHLAHSKPVMSLLSLKSLETQLPGETFMRVHKSYIVNLRRITVIERNEIVYDNGTVIPISSQYKARFQEFVERYFMP